MESPCDEVWRTPGEVYLSHNTTRLIGLEELQSGKSRLTYKLTGTGDSFAIAHWGSIAVPLFYLYNIQHITNNQMIYFITYLLFFSKYLRF